MEIQERSFCAKSFFFIQDLTFDELDRPGKRPEPTGDAGPGVGEWGTSWGALMPEYSVRGSGLGG